MMSHIMNLAFTNVRIAWFQKVRMKFMYFKAHSFTSHADQYISDWIISDFFTLTVSSTTAAEILAEVQYTFGATAQLFSIGSV